MGETSNLFSNEFCPFKKKFKLRRSNMVNGTFWKISEISTSDLANSSYGCSPHEKIAKKHWLRLSINKNFPYSHTTSLSCKCCYFMQTHQKHLHKTQTLDVHFKHFEKKSIKRFLCTQNPKRNKDSKFEK